MKVNVFIPSYNEKHSELLMAFADGIPGAQVHPLESYDPCDVAVIFGGVKKAYPPTWAKKTVLKKHYGRRLIMVESAFVGRGMYHQVGWGGAAGYGDFRADKNPPLDRWDMIGVAEDWSIVKNGYVVVMGQLPRDVQVQDVDHRAWCRETVAYYEARDIPVVFRPHPKTNDPTEYGVPANLIDRNVDLADTLRTARTVVTWNSTSAVDAVIAGVPTITMHRGSFAWDVTAHDLDTLNHACDRDRWLATLGYAQWTTAEMASGEVWHWLTA